MNRIFDFFFKSVPEPSPSLSFLNKAGDRFNEIWRSCSSQASSLFQELDRKAQFWENRTFYSASTATVAVVLFCMIYLRKKSNSPKLVPTSLTSEIRSETWGASSIPKVTIAHSLICNETGD